MSKTTFAYEGSYSNPNGSFDRVETGQSTTTADKQLQVIEARIEKYWNPNLSARENARTIRYVLFGPPPGAPDVAPESMTTKQRAMMMKEDVGNVIAEMKGQANKEKDFWAQASAAAGVKLSF